MLEVRELIRKVGRYAALVVLGNCCSQNSGNVLNLDLVANTPLSKISIWSEFHRQWSSKTKLEVEVLDAIGQKVKEIKNPIYIATRKRSFSHVVANLPHLQ